MQAFWLSLVMIFLAELGDKTQLVALTLAARYRAGVVLAGVFAATLTVHIFSAAIGVVAGGLLPQVWVQYGAGLAFLGFAFWTLRGDCLEGDEECRVRNCSPFWLVFITFFLAELGDKTMLGTVTLATVNPFVPVWLGSTVGMVLSDGLAILVGQYLGTRLPERAVRIGAAVIFFVFGAFSLARAGHDLPLLAWITGAAAVLGMALLARGTARPQVADL